MLFIKTREKNFLTPTAGLPYAISLDKLINYLSFLLSPVCVYVCVNVFIMFYIYEECFQFWCDQVSLEELEGKFQKIPPSHLAMKMYNNRHILLNLEERGEKTLFF